LGVREFLDRVPEEFAEWVENQAELLHARFQSVRDGAALAFNSREDFADRKAFAMWAKGSEVQNRTCPQICGKYRDKRLKTKYYRFSRKRIR
jgi:hypothetical protein